MAETAAILGVSPKAVEGMIQREELLTRRVGRIVLVLTSSLIEWAEGKPHQEHPPVSPADREAAVRLLERIS